MKDHQNMNHIDYLTNKMGAILHFRWLVLVLLALPVTLGSASCTRHTVEVEPVEVKPIHVTMDVNIKVQRELDNFFDFEDNNSNEND